MRRKRRKTGRACAPRDNDCVCAAIWRVFLANFAADPRRRPLAATAAAAAAVYTAVDSAVDNAVDKKGDGGDKGIEASGTRPETGAARHGGRRG